MENSARDDVVREVGSALRSLLRAGRHLQATMASQLAIGQTDLAAMDELVDGEGSLGPAELSERLEIRSASTTILLDRLEAAGYVRREPHPSDRRRLVLHTTEAARRDIAVLLTPIMRSIDRLTEQMDDDQLEALTAFLRGATEELTRYSSAP